MTAEIQKLLEVYVGVRAAASVAARFSTVAEAQDFMTALLPKEKGGARFQRYDVFQARKEDREAWMQAERDKGNVLYLNDVKGQPRLKGLCSCHATMWAHIKNDIGIEKV